MQPCNFVTLQTSHFSWFGCPVVEPRTGSHPAFCTSRFSITGYHRLAPILTSYHRDEASWRLASAILPMPFAIAAAFGAPVLHRPRVLPCSGAEPNCARGQQFRGFFPHLSASFHIFPLNFFPMLPNLAVPEWKIRNQ